MTEDDLRWLRAEFERCAHWIQAALDSGFGGTHDLNAVWEMIAADKVQLWPREKSVVVTSLEYHPRKVVLRYWLCGGDELDDCLKSEPVIEDWAKKAGAVCAVIAGRRGWVKKLHGYREAGTYMFKDL